MIDFSSQIKELILHRFGQIKSKPWMFIKPLEKMKQDELVKWAYLSHEVGVRISEDYNSTNARVSHLLDSLCSILDMDDLQECQAVARKAIENYNQSFGEAENS